MAGLNEVTVRLPAAMAVSEIEFVAIAIARAVEEQDVQRYTLLINGEKLDLSN